MLMMLAVSETLMRDAQADAHDACRFGAFHGFS